MTDLSPTSKPVTPLFNRALKQRSMTKKLSFPVQKVDTQCSPKSSLAFYNQSISISQSPTFVNQSPCSTYSRSSKKPEPFIFAVIDKNANGPLDRKFTKLKQGKYIFKKTIIEQEPLKLKSDRKKLASREQHLQFPAIRQSQRDEEFRKVYGRAESNVSPQRIMRQSVLSKDSVSPSTIDD